MLYILYGTDVQGFKKLYHYIAYVVATNRCFIKSNFPEQLRG